MLVVVTQCRWPFKTLGSENEAQIMLDGLTDRSLSGQRDGVPMVMVGMRVAKAFSVPGMAANCDCRVSVGPYAGGRRVCVLVLTAVREASWLRCEADDCKTSVWPGPVCCVLPVPPNPAEAKASIVVGLTMLMQRRRIVIAGD